MNFNQPPPRLTSYWLGYRSQDPTGKLTPTLQETPPYVGAVFLAFALVRPKDVIDTTFMCRPPNTPNSIRQGVTALRDRGTKVVLSVGGWGGNCWNSVTDVSALAANILKIVDAWGLDGVDIDFEGDHPLDDWMKEPPCPSAPNNDPTAMLCDLVNALRASLGAKRLLTAVTISGDAYITQSISQFNWIATMNYGGTNTYDDLVKTYMSNNPGTTFVPFSLGVSCADPQMPLDDVIKFCAHKPPAHKPPLGPLRMMLWDLSEDNTGFTSDPRWAYASAINSNLPK
jgi:Glycosyl hydrolases family 18